MGVRPPRNGDEDARRPPDAWTRARPSRPEDHAVAPSFAALRERPVEPTEPMPSVEPSLLLLALSGLVTFAGIGTAGQFLGWPLPVIGVVAAVTSFALWFLAGAAVRANGPAAGLSLIAVWAVITVAVIAFLHAQTTLGEAGALMQRLICASLGGHGPGGCQ